jgi:hypothetical protein
MVPSSPQPNRTPWTRENTLTVVGIVIGVALAALGLPCGVPQQGIPLTPRQRWPMAWSTSVLRIISCMRFIWLARLHKDQIKAWHILNNSLLDFFVQK